MAETLQAHQQTFISSSPSINPLKNIILINKTTGQQFNAQNQPITLQQQQNNQFSFSQLISNLKPQYPQLNRAFFFMWLNEKEYLIGADPFENERFIQIENLQETQDIIILYTESKNNKKKDSINVSSNTNIIDDNNNSSENQQNQKEMFVLNDNDDFEKVQQCLKPREKRVKERTIEYVIEKVKKWRDIYEKGIQNEKGEIVKPNLDVSAQLVYLSRKTLDDYYAQLRKGEMYGFDFQKNKHEKMGMLRKFVKEQQKNNPNQKNKGKLVEFDENQKTDLDFPYIKKEEINPKIEEEEINLSNQQQQQQNQNLNQKIKQEEDVQEENLQLKEEIENNKMDFCNFEFTNTKFEEENKLNQPRNEGNLKDIFNTSDNLLKFEDNNNINMSEFPTMTLQPSYSSKINKEHQNSENDVCNLFMNLEENLQNLNNHNQSLFANNNNNNIINNNNNNTDLTMEFE